MELFEMREIHSAQISKQPVCWKNTVLIERTNQTLNQKRIQNSMMVEDTVPLPLQVLMGILI